ncbi:MAG: hypothetical protein Q4A76_04850 [Porphyromonadaceae bacterium]|nr:hypothetical protein [Porphyromonadaceae bacterium]
MTKLIQIGGSYGIRIPKILIEKANLRNSIIDLQIVEDGLLLKTRNPRSTWDSEYLKKQADKEKLDEAYFNEDLKEWQW